MKKTYIIAYNDIDGTGFKEGFPWLHDVGDNIDIAKNHVKMLNDLGMKDVTLFFMCEEEYMETIPWSFINERKVEI